MKPYGDGTTVFGRAVCFVLAMSFVLGPILLGPRLLPAQTPPPVSDCSVELDRIRGYAVILKGDRDQKEAALAEYGAQIRTLQAEIARLKDHKETK